VYQHLNGADEFRLLIISPGSLDDALHGEVITAKLSGTGRPAYEALSYTWADETGDAERSSEFVCDEDHSIIRITKNCEAAIRRLRLSDKKRCELSRGSAVAQCALAGYYSSRTFKYKSPS
jgi:hypothetical protein